LVAPILEGWGANIASLEIVAGTGGIFDVHVNGELTFWKKMIGRYPEPDDVLPLIRDRIGPETMPRDS
jgi:selenoprotein W-related protein